MLFEQGLSFFYTKLGISLSSISSLLLIVSSCFYFNIKYLRGLILVFFSILFLYWTYSLINCIYSSSILDGLFSVIQGFYNILITIALFIIINKSKRNIDKIMNFSGLSSFIILLFFTFYQQYTGELIRLDNFVGKFSFSPYEDYNMFVLMLYFSILFAFYNKKVNFKYFLLFITMIIITLTLAFLVGSRRSIVLYTPVLLFFILGNVSKGKILFLLIILPIFILLLIQSLNKVIIVDKNYQGIESYINRSLNFFTDSSSATDSRVIRWMHVIDKFEKEKNLYLLIGFGQRSFFSDTNFIRHDGSKDNPHNFLLTAFYEGGFPKVFLICSLLLILFISIRNNNKKLRSFYISYILIFLITVSMSGSEFFTSKHIYFFLSLIASLTVFTNKDKTSSCLYLK